MMALGISASLCAGFAIWGLSFELSRRRLYARNKSELLLACSRGALARQSTMPSLQSLAEACRFIFNLPLLSEIHAAVLLLQKMLSNYKGSDASLIKAYLKRTGGYGLDELREVLASATLVAAFLLGAFISVIFDYKLGLSLAFLVLAFGPYLVLRGILAKQKKYILAIEFELPACLSMLSLMIQAGSTFDRAFDEYCSRVDSRLSKEAGDYWGLYQAGLYTRDQALDALIKEINSNIFERIVQTIKKGIHMGSPLSITLDSLMNDLSNFQKDRVEEEISKTPVKLLLPLGLCILPAMLILLLGPVLMEVLEGVSKSF